MTPPSVSMPRDRGVTSRRSRSLTSPVRTAACTAAPTATTSSGLTVLLGSLPKSFLTSSCTFGMRVCPPTRMTSSRSPADTPACLPHGLSARAEAPLDQIRHERLELGPSQREHQVFGATRIRGNKRQVDLRLHYRRQLALGLLCRFLQALEGHPVLAKVDTLLLLALVGDPVHHLLVEVITTEMGVAVGSLHLDHALADLEDRDVEGAAAEIIDGHGLVLLLVEAVCERGSRRLVDDAQDLESGDGPGILGRLSLAVVEVGGDRDDSLGHLLAQVRLRGFLQLAKHERGNLGRRVLFTPHLDCRGAVLGLDDLV